MWNQLLPRRISMRIFAVPNTQILFLATFSICLLADWMEAAVAQPNKINGRIVLVIPNGDQPPNGYEQKIRDVATRTEKYFDNWMSYWDYPIERKHIFTRNSKGEIHVEVVKATLPGKIHGNSLGQLKNLAIKHARAKMKLGKKHKAVWWVFYKYPGVKGFHGGGNADGGKAINEYPSSSQKISPDVDLASSTVNRTKIKAMIHEFGHALGLPHNGPLKGLGLGNSLMGPTTPNFRRKSKSNDERVYLNKASAALIWKHPIFRKQGNRRASKPAKFEVTDLVCREEENGVISLKAKLITDRKVHSVAVYDSVSGNYGNYWIRSHAARLDDTGNFEMKFWSPNDGGRLFVQFCFNDGYNTGDGKKQKTQLKIPYTGKPGSRKFQL